MYVININIIVASGLIIWLTRSWFKIIENTQKADIDRKEFMKSTNTFIS